MSLTILVFLLFTAIAAEKEQQQFIAGIENFDSSKLKHTVTEEKNPLPTKEGKLLLYFLGEIIVDYFFFHLVHLSTLPFDNISNANVTLSVL